MNTVRIATLLRALADEFESEALPKTLSIPASKKTTAVHVELKNKGWKHTAAAHEIGITYRHLAYILAGHRASKRVERLIKNLPRRAA